MHTISEYLSDQNFLKNAISYLESCHGVHAVIVDKNGNTDPLNGQEIKRHPYTKLYPVTFIEDIGGILCSALSSDALKSAAPHIRICIAGIENLLQKDLVIKQTMDEMLHLSDQLHFLSGLSKKLKGVHDIHQYCMLVLEEIAGEIFADAAFIHTKAEKDNPKTILYKISPEDVKRIEQDPAVLALPNDRTAIVSLTGGESTLVIPIKEKAEQIGHLVLIKNAGKRVFTSYEKQFTGIINNIISPTIESLVLYHSLHLLYLNTVKALAAAIDAKDAYTHGHSFRVARYSVAIARQLHIENSKLADLEVAAYMHDLGKIGIPESILGKPGKLSPSEFDEIKKHPLLTNKILEPIDLPDNIVAATLQHHERLDGRGYPRGLTGNHISLFARIIAVADVFDALTSARPYRKAMTVEDALTTICEGIDTEFDRNVVQALIDALQHYSEDRDLSVVYSELQFFQLDNLNQFLESLKQLLLGSPQLHESTTL